MNIDPSAVHTLPNKNMLGIMPSPKDLIRSGGNKARHSISPKPNIVAMLIALSCIISAMYSQQMGPDEKLKARTKTTIAMIDSD